MPVLHLTEFAFLFSQTVLLRPKRAIPCRVTGVKSHDCSYDGLLQLLEATRDHQCETAILPPEGFDIFVRIMREPEVLIHPPAGLLFRLDVIENAYQVM